MTQEKEELTEERIREIVREEWAKVKDECRVAVDAALRKKLETGNR